MSKNIAIAVAFVAMLWMFRYDLQTGGEGGSAHVLDRWTGKISWIRASEIEPVLPVPPPGRDLFQEFGIDPRKTQ